MKPHFGSLFQITISAILAFPHFVSGLEIIELHGSRYARNIDAIVKGLATLDLLENSSPQSQRNTNKQQPQRSLQPPELEMDKAASQYKIKSRNSHNNSPEPESKGLRRLDTSSNFPMIPFPPFPPHFTEFRGYNREKQSLFSSDSAGQDNSHQSSSSSSSERPKSHYKDSHYKGNGNNNKATTTSSRHHHIHNNGNNNINDEYFDNMYFPLSRYASKSVSSSGQDDDDKRHPTSSPFFPSRGIPSSPKEFRLPMYSHGRGGGQGDIHQNQGFSTTTHEHDNYITSRGKQGITNFLDNNSYGRSYENLGGSQNHGDFRNRHTHPRAQKESGRGGGYLLSSRGHHASGNFGGLYAAGGDESNYASPSAYVGGGHSPYGMLDRTIYAVQGEHPGLYGYGMQGSTVNNNIGNHRATHSAVGVDSIENEIGYGGLAGRQMISSYNPTSVHSPITNSFGQDLNSISNYENNYKAGLASINAAAALQGITSLDADASTSSFPGIGLGSQSSLYNSVAGYSEFLKK